MNTNNTKTVSISGLGTRVTELARHKYKKYRLDYPYSHPSFAAEKALLAVEQELNLDTYGVEALRYTDGRNGSILYLNTGEAYHVTILVKTTPQSARFYLGSWGDEVECNPGLFE